MSDIWMQTRFGKAFDLINPDPNMVDFAEIAQTLSDLPRYVAAYEKPITVGYHTLIVADAVEAKDRAHALLHDAHEAYMGDIATPVALALAEHAARAVTGGARDLAAALVKDAIASLKETLDAAIYAAAGIALPDPDTRKRIRLAGALKEDRRGKRPNVWEVA